MLNWTTGVGNARYWVLKLLLDHFKPGDKFVKSGVPGIPTSPICAVVDGHSGYGNITITCAEKSGLSQLAGYFILIIYQPLSMQSSLLLLELPPESVVHTHTIKSVMQAM